MMSTILAALLLLPGSSPTRGFRVRERTEFRVTVKAACHPAAAPTTRKIIIYESEPVTYVRTRGILRRGVRTGGVRSSSGGC